MRLHLSLLIASLLILTSPAHAGTFFEASLGYGVEAAPNPGESQDPNLMVAAGWGIGELIIAELGLVGAYPGGEDLPHQGELQIRPMLVISPPLLPLYLRGTLAFKDPFSESRKLAYGASLGLRFSLMGLGAFAELGALPVNTDPVRWIAEGRVGASLAF